MFNSSYIKELKYDIKCLKHQINDKDCIIEQLHKTIKDYQDQLKERNEYSCRQVFDFNNPSIEVFSIERSFSSNSKKWGTNIGYFIIDKSEDDKVHEWFMATSTSVHDQLVQDFLNSKEIKS